MRRKLLLLIGLCGFFAGMNAQVTERERPKEWQSLIKGGRFMDRFLPMQGSIISKDVWGADSVQSPVRGQWYRTSGKLLSGVEI